MSTSVSDTVCSSIFVSHPEAAEKVVAVQTREAGSHLKMKMSPTHPLQSARQRDDALRDH